MRNTHDTGSQISPCWTTVRRAYLLIRVPWTTALWFWPVGSSQQSEEPSKGHQSIKSILILSLKIRSDLRFSSSCDAFARCGTCCRLPATCPPNGPWAVAALRRIYANVTCIPPPVHECGTYKLTFILKYWRWIFSLKGKILVIWNFSRLDFILITFMTQEKL